MDKRLALIVTGSIIVITMLCLTVIFPFIHKQLHPPLTSSPASDLQPPETKQTIVEKQATENATITPASDLQPPETKQTIVEKQTRENTPIGSADNKTMPEGSKSEKQQTAIPAFFLNAIQKNKAHPANSFSAP